MLGNTTLSNEPLSSIAGLQSVAVSLTGTSGTGAVGNLSVIGDGSVNPTGVVGVTQSYSFDELDGTFFGFGALGTAPFGSAYQPLLIVTGNADVAAVGVEATGQTGTLDATGDSNYTLTGVEGTGAVGDVAIITDTSTSLIGVSGYGQVYQQYDSAGFLFGFGAFGTTSFGVAYESLFVQAGADVAQTGVEGTGQTGTVDVTGDSNYTLIGVEGTGQVGNVAITGDNNVNVFGVCGVTYLSAAIPFDGFLFGFSPYGTVPFAGSYDAQGAVVEVTGNADVPVTGEEATGQTGTVTVTGNADVPVTGVAGTGQVGTVTVTADYVQYVTGVVGLAELSARNQFLGGPLGFSSFGTVPFGGGIVALSNVVVDVTGDANVYPTGVEGTGQEGTVAVGIGVEVFVTGVSGTGQTGTLDAIGDANVTPAPVTGIGRVGKVTIFLDIQVLVTGVQATGQIGNVNVLWLGIDTNQTPDWNAVNDSQVDTWTPVNEAQTVTWTPVDDSQADSWVPVDDGNTVVWTKIEG